LTSALIFEMFAHTRTRKLKIMRTKTLLLSGVVAALSSASLMAQVYSLNAVGYINVTCPPGFSIIANQLNTGNNVITNLIQVDPAGSMDGDTIYKVTAGHYSSLIADSFNPPYYWDGADPTLTTLNPGEGAFFLNVAATNITFTFVGTVLQGSLTNTLANGFNLVSSLVPQGGNVFSDLGVNLDTTGASDGDTVYIMNSGHYASSIVDSYSGPSYLDGNQSPVVTVGQGFFYLRENASMIQWVRTFNVN
jgi:hypothetical protein